MKIVYLVTYPGNGGAEAYSLYLAREARLAGHEVCFVLGEETGELVEKVREEKFDLLFLPMKSSFNPFAVLNSVFKLRRIISDYKPDIIHTQMLREQSLVIAAKIFGSKTKLVRTFHRLDQFDWKMLPLMWLYQKDTDAFIAVSDFVKEYLAVNGIHKKVYVIRNGTVEVETKIKKKGLGYLGRIAPEKGIYKFIESNKELLSKTSLTVGGDGPEIEALSNLVQKKSINVKLLGRVENRNKFFELFNVLVLPSSTEALPLVVIEAFSAGTPVVAFDLPSLRGLINENNGALVKAGDYKKLASKAIEIMNSKEYKKYSTSAKALYKHSFTVEKTWFDTERLYQKLTSKA